MMKPSGNAVPGSVRHEQDAAAVLANRRRRLSLPLIEDAQRLLQELEIRRIGLEVQNEELRRTQQELQESRDRYASLYDCAPIGYVTLTPRGIINQANLAACALLETERNALEGSGFFTNVAREDRPRLGQYLWQCGEEGTPRTLELRLALRSGRLIPVQLFIVRVPDLGKSLLVAMTDMSARVEAEEELHRLNEALEERVAERAAAARRRVHQLQTLSRDLAQAEQRERRLLAQALHDNLQQMLVGAKLETGALLRKCADPAIQAGLTRVMDILAQAIAESRSLTVQLSPPILHESGLTAGLAWLVRFFQERYGLGLRFEAREEIEPADESAREVLFRAVRELLLNAVKHANASEVVVRADRPPEAPRWIRIAVCDNGVGFDPTLAGRYGEDSGFGLFSIREQMELRGGRLLIDSAPGRGACLLLELPQG